MTAMSAVILVGLGINVRGSAMRPETPWQRQNVWRDWDECWCRVEEDLELPAQVRPRRTVAGAEVETTNPRPSRGRGN